MNPAMIFLLLFIGIPLFELYWLIEIGSHIGGLMTIGLTILTAIIGASMVRQQGLSTALKMNEATTRGEVPALEMISGVVIFICGLFLLLPGFFTDAIGFLLLIPMIREQLIVYMLKRFQVIQTQRPSTYQSSTHTNTTEQKVIEGEYTREDR